MNFSESINVCLVKKYATFTGRASRSEFWYFFLFESIASTVAGIISDKLSTAVSLVLLLPSIAVFVRRLHDSGRTGWHALLPIVLLGGSAALWAMGSGFLGSLTIIAFLITGIVIFVFTILKGTDGPNIYGPDPVAEHISASAPFDATNSVPAGSDKNKSGNSGFWGALSSVPGSSGSKKISVESNVETQEDIRNTAGYSTPHPSSTPQMETGTRDIPRKAETEPSPLPRKSFCRNCGHPLGETAKFCTECGAPRG